MAHNPDDHQHRGPAGRLGEAKLPPARRATAPAPTATGLLLHDHIEVDTDLAADVQDYFEADGRAGEDVELRSSDLQHLARQPGVPDVLAGVLNDPHMDLAFCTDIDEHTGLRFATAVAVINHYQPVAWLGSGGERIVFDLGDGRVLKVSIFGGRQSQAEQDAGTSGDPIYARVDPVPATVPAVGDSDRQVAVATIQEHLVELYIDRDEAIAEHPALAAYAGGHSQIGRRADGSLCIYDLD